VKRSFVLSLGIFLSCSLQAQPDYLHVLEDQSLRLDTTYWVNVHNLIAFDTVEGWREWDVAENFSFGKNRGELQMITDLTALHPYFRDKIVQLIHNCKKKGIELSVVETYRTKAKQAEYFGMGRKYTRSPGGRSKHQYGLACDVVPMTNGMPQWDDKALWRKIGMEGERLGLRWGGRWRRPYDPAHFEWTNGVTTAQLASGYFPTPKNASYPCLEEDIKQLTRFWEAWESEQSKKQVAARARPVASSQRP
jgi:peptidoglycan L-alanyl-D-glutamate endopeptidase CwlK